MTTYKLKTVNHINSCFFCDPQKKGMRWSSQLVDGLKFMLNQKGICTYHKELIAGEIKKLEPVDREPGMEG